MTPVPFNYPAGGGITPGVVHGASDKSGAFPEQDPTTPGDVMATMYQLLGLDPRHTLYDPLGRPHRLVPSGEVVGALVS